MKPADVENRNGIVDSLEIVIKSSMFRKEAIHWHVE